MLAKPKHLGHEYAAQFEDRSVARAYYARPPYPEAVFELIESLVAARPRRLLELGAGTGDLTLRLAGRVDTLEAVEPSLAMLEIARAKQAQAIGPDNIQWIHATAEAHRYQGPYDAVVAAEALHWMSWEHVFPAIARSLKASGLLVIVCDRVLSGLPWRERERS